MDRRTAIKAAIAAPVAIAAVTQAEAAQASMKVITALDVAARDGAPYVPKFFNAHEWSTVRVLVDMIIPRDSHSGSATEAGVPEFMDFIAIDEPNRQIPLRGGLAWLDNDARKRFGKTFILATEAQRKQILDDIAWPAKATPEYRRGAVFFNSFRDFTASGFYSSRIGIDDLRYIGNVFNPGWDGCPPEALARLGVSYNQ
jgi:gluconate 2-dehydrogenase subunit 3-like protein